ncbi:MAG: DUF4446 family protein [Lachnospiraceae bacterium]|nr:DUF4446 family protein [Lachnospiraceae bacterium]
MKLFEQYGIDIGYVVLGLVGVVLLLFIILIVMMIRNHILRKRYKQFMSGENGKSLEKAFLDKFSSIETLEDEVKVINGNINSICTQLRTAYQKIGLVKYDAFKEIGGKLSFVLVLLTEDNNGFIINSMHSTKEGCYTYAKEVVNGEVFVILSEEEQQALEEAKANKQLERISID